MTLDLAKINTAAKAISGGENSARSQMYKDKQRRASQDLWKGGEMKRDLFQQWGREIDRQSIDVLMHTMQTDYMYADPEVGKTFTQREIDEAVSSDWQQILTIYEDCYSKGKNIPRFIYNMLLDERAVSALFGILWNRFQGNVPNVVNFIISEFVDRNREVRNNPALLNQFLDFYYAVNGYRADALCQVAPIDRDTADTLIMYLPKYGKMSFQDIRNRTFKALSALYESKSHGEIDLPAFYNIVVILYGRDRIGFAAVAMLLESYSRKFNKLPEDKKVLWHMISTFALDRIEETWQHINYHLSTLYSNELKRQNGERRLSLKAIDGNRYPNIARWTDFAARDHKIGQFI